MQVEKKPQINMKTLLRWLVQLQGTEVELGGFKGRTNKLVDGCYSWWCGGAFALLEALGIGGSENAVRGPRPTKEGKDRDEGGVEGDTWDDVDGLYLVFICYWIYNLLSSSSYRLCIQSSSPARIHSIRCAASCGRLA